MANLSFTSNGATPFALPTNGGNTQTSSPGTNSSPTFFDPGRGAGIPSVSANPTPYSAALNQAKAPAPATPVKSTTVTHPDGTSIATTYHPPEVSASMTPANTDSKGYSTMAGPYDPVTGLLKPGQSGVQTQQSTGTQHPGDSGYIAPSMPVNHQTQTAQAEYNSAGQYTGTAGTTSTSTPSASTPTTFPGIIGSLANDSQNGSAAGQNYTQQTADYAAGNLPIGQSAKNIADNYGKQIAQVGQAGSQFEAGQLTTGTSPIAQGNAAVTAQSTAQQQTALAQGEQAALQGTGQQLTAQGQAANASSAAAGAANTAQANEQSGLASAGQLAAPTPTAQGQTTFNPLTGQFSGGSYQQNVQDVANAIKNGNIGYSAGADSLSSLSPTAKADLLASLGSGFDTVASDANATAKGSNIQTGGTATTGANATGLSQSIQAETQLNAAATSAQALATQVSSALQNAGLNLTNSSDANTAINNLQSRLGNAAYTQLNIAVNDARSQYAAILQSSGSATPTEAGNMANENISANMSPKQILAAIDQLNNGVKARQDAAHQQTTQFQNQLSSSGKGSGSSNSSSSALNSTSAWPGF